MLFNEDKYNSKIVMVGKYLAASIVKIIEEYPEFKQEFSLCENFTSLFKTFTSNLVSPYNSEELINLNEKEIALYAAKLAIVVRYDDFYYEPIEKHIFEDREKFITETPMYKNANKANPFFDYGFMIEFFSVNNYVDLNKLLYKYFPADSEVMAIMQDIIRDEYFKNIYPLEHVICLDKTNMLGNDLTLPEVIDKYNLNFVPRSQCEWNVAYLQFSVAAIIKDTKNTYFLKSISGDLKGHLTMVQGHTSYNEAFFNELGIRDQQKSLYHYCGFNFRDVTNSEYIKGEILREIQEETSITKEDIAEIKYFTTIYPSEYAKVTDISFYHVGLIYIVELKDDDSRVIKSGEPEKHEIVTIPFSQYSGIINTEDYNSDDWVKKAVHIYNLIQDEKFEGIPY